MIVNITLFERNSFIGGRSTTVNAYDDPNIPVELGASIFVEVNSILNDAVKEFNLSTSEFIPDSRVPGAALAVWNGQEFVVTQEGGGSWWDTAKLLWR
jgi:prenylcysteine oxidase/farnesylcysteine lyase